MNQVQELTDRLKAIARRIIEHGQDAAKNGIPITDNPWKGMSHEFHIWRHGWIFETHKIHSKKQYESD